MYQIRKNTSYVIVLLMCALQVSCSKETHEPEMVEVEIETNALPIAVEEPHIQVSAGITEAELIKIAGPPDGEMMMGGKKILTYGGVMVTVVDGRVEHVPPAFGAAVAEAREAQESEQKIYDEYRRQGLVQHNGRWMTPEQRDRKIVIEMRKKEGLTAAGRQQSKPSPRSQKPKRFDTGHVIYKMSGEPVDHGYMVSSGFITVVVFFSSYEYENAVYSRQLIARLHAYEKKESRLRIRALNIKRLTSEQAIQYSVTTFPEARVFGTNRKMVGTPTSSYNTIIDYINFAKKTR